MRDILEIANVSRRFGGITAVNNASLSVAEGSVTGLVGPNGAGKTTLFNLISGFLPVNEGEVRFEGKRLTGLPAYKISRLGIGRTFQDPRVFYEMNALDHVLSGFNIRVQQPWHAIWRDRATRREHMAALARARALLLAVGLDYRAMDKAQDLSFGDQRFLSIARTLAGDPTLILLDEPTVGLDHEGIRKLSSMVNDLVREQHRTVLLVEHNLDVVFSLCDQIHLMVGGAVVLSGPPDEIRRHPKMIEAYLGTRHVASAV
jgi:branched-chain amino acid transport system ATP-binding protein